ncbi:uncharacterized protein LOC115750719 [Rhodamnia argentea]|uniref:Uncharacterized protein LOC115750719 n=1 Tax=Rhodamnia argentea TaxID=178133 RepID=A0A8B8QD52_9MYRT|nr:uncharacterized protein LOC115750719 [Rhodamnia argentea]
MNLLENPPFLSQILSRSWPQQAFSSQAFEVCKWSAIILATLACFGALTHRVVKLSGLRFPKSTPLPARQPLVSDFDDSDGDDDTCSSSSEQDDGLSDEEELPSPSGGHSHGDFNFRLVGSGDTQLRRRRSFADNLSQFVLGKSVVKLWDRSDSRLLRLQDSNGEFVGRFCQVLVSPRSPAAVMSAGLNNLGKIALNVWDSRVGFRIPAMVAEWEQRAGGEVTVGDLRNVISPVEDSSGADAERWWDADEVTASDES